MAPDLPISSAASTAQRAAPCDLVLLVEDDIVSRSAMDFLLRHFGFRTLLASGVAEALEHLAAAKPHCVVLDLMLPDGNGIEVLRRLRAAGSAARVIVTTAVSDPGILRDVQALAPHRLLRKPIDLVDLLGAIGKM